MTKEPHDVLISAWSAEPVQVKGEEMVWCSNCDETHVLIYSCNGKLYEQWTTAPGKTSKSR